MFNWLWNPLYSNDANGAYSAVVKFCQSYNFAFKCKSQSPVSTKLRLMPLLLEWNTRFQGGYGIAYGMDFHTGYCIFLLWFTELWGIPYENACLTGDRNLSIVSKYWNDFFYWRKIKHKKNCKIFFSFKYANLGALIT